MFRVAPHGKRVLKVNNPQRTRVGNGNGNGNGNGRNLFEAGGKVFARVFLIELGDASGGIFAGR